MKTRNPILKDQSVYYETVTPFEGVVPAEDGLFDDCPICQAMRKQIEKGELELVEMD